MNSRDELLKLAQTLASEGNSPDDAISWLADHNRFFLQSEFSQPDIKGIVDEAFRELEA
jgi:hypothetical protein